MCMAGSSREIGASRITIFVNEITTLLFRPGRGVDRLAMKFYFQKFWSRMQIFKCRVQAVEARGPVCTHVAGVPLDVEL